jgi:hypothetical protein
MLDSLPICLARLPEVELVINTKVLHIGFIVLVLNLDPGALVK